MTVTLSLFGRGLPNDGNARYAPYSVEHGSAPAQNPEVLIFASGVDGYVKGAIRIPDNYSSTPEYYQEWTSETVAGDIKMNVRTRVTKASSSHLLDISTSPTELSNTFTSSSDPGLVSEHVTDTLTLSATDWAAGDLLYFEIEREGSHADDDKADAITVWDYGIKFTPA